MRAMPYKKQLCSNELQINTNLVDVNGRKHILKHRCHQFEVQTIATEVVHNQQRMAKKLRLGCMISLQH